MTDSNPHDLWRFACNFYEREGVKVACLQLQNEHGADVLLVLWLCWLQVNAIRLDEQALTQVQALQSAWQHPLQQLRTLRNQLPANTLNAEQHNRIRKQVLATELAIEQSLLEQLQAATETLPENTAHPLMLEDYLITLKPELKASQVAWWREVVSQVEHDGK